MSPAVKFQTLPTEVLIDIFRDLTYYDLILNIAPTCRRFRALINDPAVIPIFKCFKFRKPFIPSIPKSGRYTKFKLHPIFKDIALRVGTDQDGLCINTRSQVHKDNFIFKWSSAAPYSRNLPKTPLFTRSEMSQYLKYGGASIKPPPEQFDETDVPRSQVGRVLSSPFIHDNATDPPVDVLFFSYNYDANALLTYRRPHCSHISWQKPLALGIYRDPASEGGVTVLQILQAQIEAYFHYFDNYDGHPYFTLKWLEYVRRDWLWAKDIDYLKLCELCRKRSGVPEDRINMYNVKGIR